MKKEVITKESLCDVDFVVTLISALRYGLGRQTYAVDCIATTIESFIPYLSRKDLYVINRDIQTAINDAHSQGHTLGADFDETRWVTLAKKAQARYTELACR